MVGEMSGNFGLLLVQFRRTSLTGFPAQSIRSSNAIALDSPYLLVLITGTSQSRQHVDTSLIHLESRKSPTKSLFDVGSRRISIVTVNTKDYHSDVLAGADCHLFNINDLGMRKPIETITVILQDDQVPEEINCTYTGENQIVKSNYGRGLLVKSIMQESNILIASNSSNTERRILRSLFLPLGRYPITDPDES
ncbi:hypothetical protein Tco_1109157 [Tanacetum coccineum]